MLEYENYDVQNVYSSVNFIELGALLKQTGYDVVKTQELVHSFEHGFDLGYRGPMTNIRRFSPNLKFTIGNETELWNKVMKEVELKRFAGPFDNPPFEDFVQSPIGLVPKDGGRKTRLIFHLSYPRNKSEKLSINANTPAELGTVKYKDIDDAIRLCIKQGPGCSAGKSDLSAAFRQLGIAKIYWKFLVMKAKHPRSKVWAYFFDKCMPFGSTVSCAQFQKFSDALAHILKVKTSFENVNYLDDFFFTAWLAQKCNQQLKKFIEICHRINFPISDEKTVWATTLITFLGLMLDTLEQKILIPLEKVKRALEYIDFVLKKPNKRIKLKQLQQLCGFLNFLTKAIVPGRVFNRRLYAKGAHLTNENHHLPVDGEMRRDLLMWRTFLRKPQAYARNFAEFDRSISAVEINFFTDASSLRGCGGVCGSDWFIFPWENNVVTKFGLHINYLELYGLAIGVKLWIGRFKDQTVIIHCDNMGVVHMVNNTTSKCKDSMVLLRIIMLECLIHNVRLQAQYIPTNLNVFADALSRMDYARFRRLARERQIEFSKLNTPVPEELMCVRRLLIRPTNCRKEKKAKKKCGICREHHQ